MQNGINITDKILTRIVSQINDDESTIGAIPDSMHKEKTILIEKIVEMIEFGLYERKIRDSDSQIYVVSIVGK